MTAVASFLAAFWQVLLKLYPSLLLGLSIAGLIHVYLSLAGDRRSFYSIRS